ncbi:hypothetical protein HYH03_009490 [Edaphochlamys debaryana]|uniref:EamA domain-containing protein n=1 Tax=Edaphochlamys debaryana TaxID=47281 RepID=A0A835Y095_9CHLO|nr:hypothetical protein HYH03_009490 [Edaphochlamys debaryana]|eukprot:KAG2492248.1 hypothetical protein HYH03_009490 [Edaphochlamys debaryana]
MGLRVVFLAMAMLAFGTINTLTTKFQDMVVVGRTPEGKPLTFNHPAVQSGFMFFGELLCLLPHFFGEWRYAGAKSRVKRRAELAAAGPGFRARRVLAFAIPACCDAVATTLLNLGLYYTFASTYQMLRGTLVLFAGFFTVTILRRRLFIHHWLGMALITGGAALVGAASVLQAAAAHGGHASGGGGDGGGGGEGGGEAGVMAAGGLVLGARRLAGLLLGAEAVDGASAPLFGDLCVVAAQAFTALQFILEEKFVAQYRVPTLLAVGLEGAWGTGICALALPLLAAIHTGPEGRPMDSAGQAFREIAANGQLAAAVAVGIVSIGFFNFFGISVTKALSGAARATIDACRTIFIWLACMALGWERFLPLQVVGFAVLFAGTSLYNELIRICLPRPEEEEEEEEEGSGDSGSESEEGSGAAVEGGKRRAKGAAGDTEAGLSEPLLPSGRQGSAGSGPRSPGSAPLPLPLPGGLPSPSRGAQVPVAAAPAHGRGRRGGAAAEAPDGSDWEYTMARSMRLGQSTLLPHALDADTDDGAATESEAAGASPGAISYGSGHTGGLLSHPNIPEGDEGPQEDEGGSGSGAAGCHHSIAIGPGGRLGGTGRRSALQLDASAPSPSNGTFSPVLAPFRSPAPATAAPAAMSGTAAPEYAAEERQLRNLEDATGRLKGALQEVTQEPAGPDAATTNPAAADGTSSGGDTDAPPRSVQHLRSALAEAAGEPGATIGPPQGSGPGGRPEADNRWPPGVPLTPATPAADPSTHTFVAAPGTQRGRVDVVEQVDVMDPGRQGKALGEALIQARERAPAQFLPPGRPLRDPLATEGTSDESDTTPGTGTGGGGGSVAASPPPDSLEHLRSALAEAAWEPGATIGPPPPEGASRPEHPNRGPPGVPLTPATPAADPSTHTFVAAPGTQRGRVDVVEQLDVAPLQGEGMDAQAAASLLEQVAEPRPDIGPAPLRDPLAERGSSDESEGPAAAGAGGEVAEEAAAAADEGSGGPVDALGAAAAAIVGSAVSGGAGGQLGGTDVQEGGGGGPGLGAKISAAASHVAHSVTDAARALADRAHLGGGGHVSGGGSDMGSSGGSGGLGSTVGAAGGKISSAASHVAHSVTDAARALADRAPRALAAAAAAVAGPPPTQGLFGGGEGAKGEVVEEALMQDVITGGDQGGDLKKDWASGPAP